MMLFKRREELEKEPKVLWGANVVTLDDDMLTTSSEPVRIVPGQFAAEEPVLKDMHSMRQVLSAK